jgi:hypothetical protein
MKKLLTCLVLLTAQFAGASTIQREFSSTPARIAEAAKKSIESRGLVTGSSNEGMSLDFASGETWGRINVLPAEGGAMVSITSNEIRNAWGKPKKSPDAALMQGIADDLEGKEIKGDDKQRWKAREMEHERTRVFGSAYAAPGPATVLVHSDRETVKSALVSECALKGFTISGETEHAVTVFKDKDAEFNFVGRILFGNYVVRAYRANIQFVLSAEDGGTRVTTTAEVLAQNGYGAIVRQVVTDDPQAKGILQSVLDGLKSRVERVQ